MFVDQVKIYVEAGDGGDGCVSFRREKFVPQGGPDGGDGGRGGNIIFEVDPQLSTLVDLRYQQHYVVKHGGHGSGHNSSGRGSEDRVIAVPVGTLVRDFKTGEMLGDLVMPGQRMVAAKGGKGGRGNSRFKTAVRQAPVDAEPGEPGESRWLTLELKLLADVALVGFPNAGKSSLMAAMTRANPKVGVYPFTTLHPNLGVATWHDAKRRAFHVTIADVPGLIEGAHEGKGLGIRFLKHLERTTVLLHLVDVSIMAMNDPVTDFEIIRDEMIQYDEKMSQKPFFVAATKIDIVEDSEKLNHLRGYCEGRQIPFFEVSSASAVGVQPLIRTLGLAVVKYRKTQATVLKSDADEVS
ncbi:GTP-binding protein Obg [hydrothermal vent metagenome]|uniref:GTP-binding protein Obg n=1 Tax=hydrothermal vent metagenome TaxID=652676 RepID=A0A3B1DH38_9ZZZZ